MDLLSQTYFEDILHKISQGLLLPTVILLLALMLYAVWCIGSFAVEALREHKHFKVVMPCFLDDIMNANEQDLPQVIKNSGLLGSQKRALLTLWDYRCLPVDTHVALAKRLLAEEEDRRMRVVLRTSTVSKIAPMLGLMGTLIPLGPGLIGLGNNDTQTLSNSLLVAFDTTVAGLVVALVAYVFTKVRRRWYDNYMSAMEAAATAILEKVDAAREAGTLNCTEPGNSLAEFDEENGTKGAKGAKGVGAGDTAGAMGTAGVGVAGGAMSASDAGDAAGAVSVAIAKHALQDEGVQR